MKNVRPRATCSLLLPLCFSIVTGSLSAQSPARWKSHDPARPRPPVVTPAAQNLPVAPPDDALVLFGGETLDQWRDEAGGAARWAVQDGAMFPPSGAEDLYSARSFGDVQLHLEWASPAPARGSGQGRGNSGVFFMGMYEVQVLDSYQSDTYPDGQAAAIYGQFPPLVNACRPPGEWQTYDIVFRRPRFHRDGTLWQPARMTVLHNNILVQDSVELWGETMWLQHLPYSAHPDRLPIVLQDHGSPVRFRNIWVRELEEWSEPGPSEWDERPTITLEATTLDRYTGKYRPRGSTRTVYEVTAEGRQLRCNFYWNRADLDLVPHSTTEFSLRWTAARVVFALDDQGRATRLRFFLDNLEVEAERVD